MKQFIPLSILVGITALIYTSCEPGGMNGGGGEGGDPHSFNPVDTTAPSLTINTPVANQVYTSGSSINVTGLITDDYGLYRGFIRIVNDFNGFQMLNQPYDIHGVKNYNFSVAYTPTVTVSTDFSVVVSFEDHGSNITTKTVKVKVNP